MPKISYNESEILVRGKSKKPVNNGGNIYIGREYQGEYVEWIILKKVNK